MAKQCTARKRVKDSEWFKEKMLFGQAQETRVVLNNDQQDFLDDSLEETDDYNDLQLQAIANLKADYVDAYHLNCDDEATTNAIFMGNLCHVGSLNDDTVEPRYDSDILFEAETVAIAAACYTQNCSLIPTHYNKTPYELLRDHKPELKYLYIFVALCYLTNNFKDLGKLPPKADIGIFIGYSPSKKAYRIYNKRTRQIMETMNLQFNKLNQMAFEQLNTVGSSSSTSIDKDAPSPSTLPNIEATNSPLYSTNVETNEEVAEFDSDTFTNPFAPPDTSLAESSLRIVDASNIHTF
nr:retrovirus-related Pol polyprotein from transposon TNT 1-94 [Tanacetum cinerariifolium]